MTFEEYWKICSSVTKEGPSDFPEAVEWALDDSKERVRRIFEASGPEAVMVATQEILKLSAELYGARFGLPPHVANRPAKLQPAWLQFVIESAKEGEPETQRRSPDRR